MLKQLKIKLEEHIPYDVFNCFIEINEPSIEDCLDEIIHKYKKIFFFPLLLFDGKHMIRDVKKKVNNFIINSRNIYFIYYKYIINNQYNLSNNIYNISRKFFYLLFEE